MDDELKLERERRIKVEQELAEWHNGLADRLSADELEPTIQKQQIESLTYHLLVQRRQAAELKGKLEKKEQELKSAVKNIEVLEKRLEEYENKPQTPKIESADTVGQKFGAAWIPSDEELDDLLDSEPERASAHREADDKKSPPKRKKHKPVKDFIQLIKRMERIKLMDAALLMDMGQGELTVWVKALEQRGYVRMDGDKTIKATKKLISKR
jgi:hypothetical protein